MLPRFGTYRIGRIPPDEIENWLNDEIDAGTAPSSVHRHYRTLRRMLQVAVDKQKLLANPCQRVQPPRVPSREMVFLGWAEVAALANAHSERYRTLICLAVDSGMRWSELVGGVVEAGTSRPGAYVGLTRGRRTNTALVPDPDGLTDPAEMLAGVIRRPATGVTAHAVRDRLRGQAVAEAVEDAGRMIARLDQLQSQPPPARRLVRR